MKLLSLGFAFMIAACGGKSAPVADQTQPPSSAAADDPSCPLVVPGTSISVEDTAGGAALVFVTTGDVLAVRARAAALAEMHTKHDGPPQTLGMMFSPGSTATATEVDGGARVEFVAAQPDQAGAIQKELHMHAGHLTTGTCEM